MNTSVNVSEACDNSSGMLLYLHEPTTRAMISSYFVTVMVLSILGNTTVCVIVARHYQLHTATNALIANIALCHLLFALICVPIFLQVLLGDLSANINLWWCPAVEIFNTFFATEASLSLMITMYDRVESLKKLTYHRFSKPWVSRSIALTWLSSFCLSFPYIFIERDGCWRCFTTYSRPTSALARYYHLTLVVIGYFSPIVVVGYVIARTWQKLISTKSNARNKIAPCATSNLQPHSFRQQAEIRTTKTLLTVALVQLSGSSLSYWQVLLQKQSDDGGLPSYPLILIGRCLAWGTYCCFPIIYALRNSRFSLLILGRTATPKSLYVIPDDRGRVLVHRFTDNEQWTMKGRTASSLFEHDDTRSTNITQSSL